MLLGQNICHAQQVADFIIPANSYTVSSASGTFTDISGQPQTKKCAANPLPDGATLLRDYFFVNANSADPAAPENFVYHKSDKTKTDPGFPLGFTFNFCGKKMTHFTICATGGIYFGESANIRQAQGSAWQTMWNDQTSDHRDIVTTAIYHNDTLNPIAPIAGQSPVCYLIDGTDGNHVLTVQYHYAVKNNEWRYQIKAYEATGRIELVVDELKTDNLPADSTCSFFWALLENGNYNIENDQFKDMAIINGNKSSLHYMGMTQSAPNAWQDVQAYLGQEKNYPLRTAGMTVTGTDKPAHGRTLAFNPPADCAEKAELYPACYSFALKSLTKSSFNGTFSFDKNKTTPEEMQNAGTMLVVLSTDKNPTYTLSNGIWYKAGDPLSDGKSRVLANKYILPTIVNGQLTYMKNLDVSDSQLEAATTYYLHVHRMDFKCTGAPVYSDHDASKTFTFTSSFDLPSISAGFPSTTGVPLTVKSGASNLGVLLLKSPEDGGCPLTDGHRYAQGDKIPLSGKTEAEVIAFIENPGQSGMTIPLALEPGEGCYILAYSIQAPTGDQPVYASDFRTLPVRAAYEGLPLTLGFEKEKVRHKPQNDYPYLPFGWSREIELTKDKSFAFGISQDEEDDRIYLLSSYSFEKKDNQWIDVITPAFVPHKEIVQATFFVSATKSQFVDAPTNWVFSPDDKIRLEYAVKDGDGWQDWQELLLIAGGSDDFPSVDASGYYPIQATIKDLKEDDMVRLRYSYQSPNKDLINNRIHRVEIIEGRACIVPASLQAIDSLTTGTSLTFRWRDDELQQAPYFIVAHGPANTDEAQWERRRVRTSETPGVTLTNLQTGTLYAAKVAAICSGSDTSFFSLPVPTRTALLPPYFESMAVSETDGSPFDRGIQALNGNIGGALTEDEAGWNQSVTSANGEEPIHTVAINDYATDAWLLLPPVYIRPDAVAPMSFSFSLSGFDDDKNKGIAPQRPDVQLLVLVSGNGQFTNRNRVLTLSGQQLAARDSVCTIDLTGHTGYLRVAFLFLSPNAESPAYADLDPWYLEVSDCRLDFDADVCFPVENLKRRLLVGEVPLSWDASTTAVAYGVYWGAEQAEGYSDSVFVQENNYTITTFKGNVRHKAMVIAFCSEDHSLHSEPVTTTFTPMLPDAPCPTPTDFHYINLTQQSVDFVSSVEPTADITGRLVYLWKAGLDGEADMDEEARIFAQANDTLPLHGVLSPQTAYIAATRAVCASDTSEMSDGLPFKTLPKDTTATESMMRLSALFSLSSQDGEIIVRNPHRLPVETVAVYNLSGRLLQMFAVNSSDDLRLPVAATRQILFVRIRTEQGPCVHKLYH